MVDLCFPPRLAFNTSTCSAETVWRIRLARVEHALDEFVRHAGEVSHRLQRVHVHVLEIALALVDRGARHV